MTAIQALWAKEKADTLTLTEALALNIYDYAYAPNREEIDKLSRTGPRGGRNARHIAGWSQSPHQTITKACNMAGIPTMPWWSGSAPTPSTAIPTVVEPEAWRMYCEVFE